MKHLKVDVSEQQRRREEGRIETGAEDAARNPLCPSRGSVRLQCAHPAVLRNRGVESTFLPEWSADTVSKPSDRQRQNIKVWWLWYSNCHYQTENKATNV